MFNKKIEKEIMEETNCPIFGSLEAGQILPNYKIGKESVDPRVAYQLVKDQLVDEGNARQNLATFCQTYMEQEENGTIHKTIAGCPDRTKEILDFTNFNTMFSLTEENGIEYYNKYGKLVPKRVKGGVILKPAEFSIKEEIQSKTKKKH